ncbi:hypothetical protein JL722_1369 [Aureococcus anophagefferens]|nr:hypothetical protein JL722_1369 [Aureococcus anophagefferens]
MARHEEHAIIFIDEIDSMCGRGEASRRRRIKTEFLVQMQGVSTRKDGLLTMLVPCTAYPSCAYCPINVSTKTVDLADCLKCGAKRMAATCPASVKVPDVSVEDFEHIVNKSRKTVAEEQLDQFVEWTREFGQEGGSPRRRALRSPQG